LSAGRLDLWQGTGELSVTVYNRSVESAKTDDDLHLVVVKGSGPVFAALNGARNWRLESDARGHTPPLSAHSGSRVSFLPGVAGSFRLIASSDGDQFVARLAVVQVTFEGREAPRATPVEAAGMSLEAVCLLEGGGRDRRLGTNLIVLGNVANLLADTLEVHYRPSGKARELPGGTPPLLDTSRDVPGFGGSEVFRAASRTEVCPGPPPGLRLRLTSSDNPSFHWADPHPVTGRPARSVTGGNHFREFIVAYSLSFPHIYTALYQADWIATPNAPGHALVVPATPVSPGQEPVYSGPKFAARMDYRPPR
jgi:hypothetical protein